MTKFIDISPILDSDSPVWPGDVSFSQSWQCQLDQGDTIDLSAIHTTVHVGSHADAPSHFVRGGSSIDQVDVSAYWGECQVIEIKKSGAISREDIEQRWDEHALRLLIRTDSFNQGEPFDRDFAFFEPKAIEWLGTKGVVLIGIDTPSFDQFDSKDLPAHRMLARFDIRNLECLDLREAPPGRYEMVALPLKIRGADASPVRAVLKILP